MNSRRLLPLLSLMVSLTLLLSLTPPALAAAQATVITTNTRIPIEFFVVNSCTGEAVTLNGTSHLLFHHTTSAGGTSNTKLEINFALRGEGASGIQYVANETVTATTESNSNGTFVFHTVSHLNVISQGSADNLYLRTEIHATFNANGELTSSKFVFTVECRG